MTYGYNRTGANANVQATGMRSTRTETEKAQEASITLDIIPFIGDAKGFVETFTGTDLVTGESLGMVSRALGLFMLSELRTIGKASDVIKSGKWIRTNEHMSEAAASYQKQITGMNASEYFKLDGVKFDGLTKKGTLLDAKSGM